MKCHLQYESGGYKVNLGKEPITVKAELSNQRNYQSGSIHLPAGLWEKQQQIKKSTANRIQKKN